MITAELIMGIIVTVALFIYIWGMSVIGSKSLKAENEPPEIDNNLLNVVALVTTTLSMNAGAYLGIEANTAGFFTEALTPTDIRGIATIIYFLVIVAGFFISYKSKHPHASLTDMAGTLGGFLAGVLTVFLGR